MDPLLSSVIGRMNERGQQSTGECPSKERRLHKIVDTAPDTSSHIHSLPRKSNQPHAFPAPPAPGPIAPMLRSPRMSITVQQILDAAAPAAIFFSRQHAFAALPLGAFAQQAVPLHAPGFRHWLIQQCCDQYGGAPSAHALAHAVRVFQARARFSPSAELHHHLAALPGRIVLDLHSPSTEVVNITPDGWSVDLGPDIFFRASRNSLPLPAPVPAAAPSCAAPLSELLNISPADMPAILAWLLTALRPTGPYPILVLKGQPGSGKSTAAHILRSLIDPRQPALRRVPTRASRLLHLALQNHVLAFDDVTALTPQIAESLTAISTGDCIDVDDRLGPTAEPAQIELQRPIILVLSSHSSSPLPPGLAGRTISVELPEIRPARRRTTAAIHDTFQRLHPEILGRLCDALSAALAGHASIRLHSAPRFADAAAWLAAAAPALHLPAPDLIAALDRREIDPLARSVHTLLESHNPWTGTASALLDALATIAPVPWLTNARGLSQRLRACSIPGVRATFEHTKAGSRITLERAGDGDFEFDAKKPAATPDFTPQPSETKTLNQPHPNNQKNSKSPSPPHPRANGLPPPS